MVIRSWWQVSWALRGNPYILSKRISHIATVREIAWKF